MPTLLDWLGLETWAGVQGRSMAGWIAGEDAYHGLPAFSEMPLEDERQGERRAVRVGDWKYIVWGRRRPPLFDLATDPLERHNVYDAHPERVASMAALMAAHQADSAKRAAALGAAGEVVLDEATLRDLEALGYVR